ncbi:hypothetical protein FGO68_gene12148 [Halteria grandinella]|uniref:RING-type domain-containing protein n=1 Tax=Halteria grandinella TaxID=5974 RepID=A0A8J8T586_HALGN|nr:hypothetical protein FGO68_gene12148 [Halteria grandinella]
MNEEQLTAFHDLYFDLILSQLQTYNEEYQNIDKSSYTCSICYQPYSSNAQNQPKVLTECGHTFCSSCIPKISERRGILRVIRCPLDKMENIKAIVNYQVISMIDTYEKQMKEFKPSCDLHNGQELNFYNHTEKKFYCRNCTEEAHKAIITLDNLHYFSFDLLKPQILERLSKKLNELSCKEPEMIEYVDGEHLEEINIRKDNLVKFLKHKKDEELKRFSDEADARIEAIEKGFEDEVFANTINLKIEQFQKQKKIHDQFKETSARFIENFSKFLKTGEFQEVNIDAQKFRQMLKEQETINERSIPEIEAANIVMTKYICQ